ncbi:hypothetical protein HMPREF9248_1160 [Fannyhessea vaginae PB189-T1-4]|uniref:Uncharacterized protein n=1 Tax=Fannyhessea vaginae PB189-T1-4 TaxID=866774 RepID=A0ABN0B1H6_9ACTN|nr:hypothetical protein HMPREF9248_1160 [Fannyhessea vaginae PB189-T1-4]
MLSLMRAEQCVQKESSQETGCFFVTVCALVTCLMAAFMRVLYTRDAR